MSDRITAGEFLTANHTLQSTCGRFEAVMQTDGNLVVWAKCEFGRGRKHLWQLCKVIRHLGVFPPLVPDARLAMQPDGNLVLLKPGNVDCIWSAGTHGNPGAFCALQPDGNLVVIHNGNALWASGSAIADQSSYVVPGQLTISLEYCSIYPNVITGTAPIENLWGETISVRAPDTGGYISIPDGGRAAFARLPGALAVAEASRSADAVPAPEYALEEVNGGIKVKRNGLPMLRFQ